MSKHALEDLEHQDTALPCKTLDLPLMILILLGKKKANLGSTGTKK